MFAVPQFDFSGSSFCWHADETFFFYYHSLGWTIVYWLYECWLFSMLSNFTLQTLQIFCLSVTLRAACHVLLYLHMNWTHLALRFCQVLPSLSSALSLTHSVSLKDVMNAQWPAFLKRSVVADLQAFCHDKHFQAILLNYKTQGA